jgi:integrase
MSKKPKTYRKAIRIKGELINSPTFPTKAMADEWYRQMKDHKAFVKFGMISGQVPTFLEYTSGWIQKRMKSRPKATWAPDEQRLRDYLLPHLSEFPMNKITRNQMRAVLDRVVNDDGRSTATRTLVQRLASKIFNDCMNEDPPLRTDNPASRLKFTDARKGKKRLVVLEDEDEILTYLRIARELSELHFVIACIGVMAGLRKGEIIGLQWRNVKAKSVILRVEQRCDQFTMSIQQGSKGGSEESRDVHVPAELIAVLLWYRERVKFNKETDFIVHDEDGEWIRPRKFHDVVTDIGAKFGRHLSPHKLRHTYGRHFAAKTGNLQALQQMLGHKSLATTQIYSQLSGRQLSDFREATAIGVSDEIGSD